MKGVIVRGNHPWPEDRAQRDELLRLYGHVNELTARAIDILKADLARYRNRITEDHAYALLRILLRYGMLAARLDSGRWVFDLDTGMGKTLSIVAWVKAVLDLELPFSVAVAASQVEALCDIKRALVETGVDPERIGLKHGKKYSLERADAARHGDPHASKDYASLPATEDNDKRQVLLATHCARRRSSTSSTSTAARIGIW